MKDATQSSSSSMSAKNNLSRTGPLSRDSNKRDFARQQHVNCIIHCCPYIRVTAQRGTEIFGINKHHIKTIMDEIISQRGEINFCSRVQWFFRPARGGGTWWEQTAVGKLYVWMARHSPITDFPEAPGPCCLDQPDVQTVPCGWLPLQTDGETEENTTEPSRRIYEPLCCRKHCYLSDSLMKHQ